MTQGERVKAIRKFRNLTLENFGNKVGVTKQTISRIENGVNNLTEQMTKSICREFGVDYNWLTTGIGEMFIDNDNDFIEQIDRIMVDENETRKNIFKTLLYASDEDINVINKLIDYYIDLRNNPSAPINDSTEALEAAYKKSRCNSAQSMTSSALNIIGGERTNKAVGGE